MASFVIGISFSSVYAGIPWDTADIADDAITSDKIKNKQVKNADIRGNTIKSGKIRDGTIISADIANDAIGTVHIADGAIQAADTNINSVQVRIKESCSPGSSIRAVSALGEVTCWKDGRGISSFFFTTTKSASAINGETTFVDLGSQNNRFCTLTKVQLRDVDGSTENAFCEVFQDLGSNTWKLKAFSEDDADAFCAAKCLGFSISN